MIYVTRRETFSASHRLYNPRFSPSKNRKLFDKCANPNGHGHNYTLEVTVAGEPDPATGYVVDLKELKELVRREVIARMDHKHLNHDVPILKGVIPTAENIAMVVWNLLEKKIRSGRLYEVRLRETENNVVVYRGGQ